MHIEKHHTEICHPFPTKAQIFLGDAKFTESPKPLHLHPQRLSCNRASEKRGSGGGGVVVAWVVVGGLDSAYLRTLSAAVAAAEFLTVAISRTPK